MSHFDVIIIGCGPSGTAAAISLAQSGLKVTIIESENFPRHRPGETLHPGIEPLLKQLGVAEKVLDAGFLRHAGNWVKWEGEAKFVLFGADEQGAWKGFQAWRADFDAILHQRALELGVEIRQPCRALQSIVNQNRVVGIETSDGILTANFIIDAAGNRQWLARQLNLEIKLFSPRLIAHFGYVEGECPVRDNAPAIVADKQGWTWTAKVQKQLYQWTRLTFTNESIDKNWLPEEFQNLQPKGKINRADVTWRIVVQPAGLGYFIVGDGAAVLDPASSHGVLKAIMSGIMAGHAIAQINNQSKNELQITQAYSHWIENWFRHDLAKLKELYAILPNPPEWI